MKGMSKVWKGQTRPSRRSSVSAGVVASARRVNSGRRGWMAAGALVVILAGGVGGHGRPRGLAR